MTFITHETVIFFLLYMALCPVKRLLTCVTCCSGVPHVTDKSQVDGGCTNKPCLLLTNHL